MDVSAINTQTSSTQVKAPNNDLTDKNVFLKILAAQLSNQDPMNAQDDTQYISQMAQFSALEQTQNLNTTMASLLTSQKLTEGAMLIGKNVQFSTGEDSTVNAVVQGVIVNNGTVSLKTDNGTYDIDSVAGVGDIQDQTTGGSSSTAGITG